ncbi:TIGR03767 family metallophosphoesterase [Rhodococcus sp. X156]|uniref:TIGR03767 family metallophosphoesterase n=1 Tax=Rhodococcus sp. X156 TaxID=2499145 RepID=UPI001F49EBD7|nr:TIGR03767 family metallophosphoesterase [Rhodococcus sp. X156]
MTQHGQNGWSRRKFLGAAGAAGALWAVGTAGPAQAVDRAVRRTAARAVTTAGTTLEAVATRVSATGYTRLTAGPGWPLVVRTDLAPAGAGRDDARTPLASFVQLTDVHVIDTESPVRFEYVHPFNGSAHRPQETLGTQGTSALIRRINSLARTGGPFTGRPFDCLVSTGDNTDNYEQVELDWFLTSYNGGTITPTTGDLTRYEGVQSSGVPLYWNPASPSPDLYKDKGFPQLPGLLDAAIRPFTTEGIDLPWYSVFGNHDNSVQGTLPPGIPFFDDAFTGNQKIMGPSSMAAAQKLVSAMETDPQAVAGMVPETAGLVRTVTPDARRRPFTPREYIRAHLDPANAGRHGPVGHGFTPGSDVSGIAYYTFEIAPGVVGITMDSTNRIGFTEGSLGEAQLRWIERTLVAGSSRYFDAAGNETRHSVSDTYFVLFSHHTSTTMNNLLPDPENLLEARHSGAELVALLQRFPNVLAWVNGHSHQNLITARRGPDPERSFWEINTASHIDYPQHARLLEVVDNADGTLSLFTTLVEAESPYQASYTDGSPQGLASLYRELAFNDIHADPERMGAPADHNTELLVPNPLGARAMATAPRSLTADWW